VLNLISVLVINIKRSKEVYQKQKGYWLWFESGLQYWSPTGSIFWNDIRFYSLSRNPWRRRIIRHKLSTNTWTGHWLQISGLSQLFPKKWQCSKSSLLLYSFSRLLKVFIYHFERTCVIALSCGISHFNYRRTLTLFKTKMYWEKWRKSRRERNLGKKAFCAFDVSYTGAQILHDGHDGQWGFHTVLQSEFHQR
jgi:hypothetical protein